MKLNDLSWDTANSGADKDTATGSESEDVTLSDSNAETEQMTTKEDESSESSAVSQESEDTITDDEGFSKPKKFSASIKAAIPAATVAMLFGVMSFFPDAVANGLFSPEDLKKLPESIAAYLPSIFKVLLSIVALVFLFFSFKAKSQGTLFVYEGYLKHKTGLLANTKIAYQDIQAVDIHRNILSGFFDIGDLEVTSSSAEIKMSSIENPKEIKSLIEKLKEKTK